MKKENTKCKKGWKEESTNEKKRKKGTKFDFRLKLRKGIYVRITFMTHERDVCRQRHLALRVQEEEAGKRG